jgi:hypothetical protein
MSQFDIEDLSNPSPQNPRFENNKNEPVILENPSHKNESVTDLDNVVQLPPPSQITNLNSENKTVFSENENTLGFDNIEKPLTTDMSEQIKCHRMFGKIPSKINNSGESKKNYAKWILIGTIAMKVASGLIRN